MTRTANHGIEHRFDTLKDSVQDVFQTTVKTVTSQANGIGKLIKRHPIAALAIAFGAGYIVMRIARR